MVNGLALLTLQVLAFNGPLALVAIVHLDGKCGTCVMWAVGGGGLPADRLL